MSNVEIAREQKQVSAGSHIGHSLFHGGEECILLSHAFG